MNYLFLLWIIPSASSSEFKLDQQIDNCQGASTILNDSFTKYFGIPLEDDDVDDFEKYFVYNGNNSVPLNFPQKPTIEMISIFPAHAPKVCYETSKPKALKGVIYIVEKDFDNMTVFRSTPKSFPIEIATPYATIFSKSKTGTTLEDFVTNDKTSFKIYSGLLGENEEKQRPIYEYDSNLQIDEIYIEEDRFHIISNGDKFNLSIRDGGEPASEKIFDTNGFILTPKYPFAPVAPYLNLTVEVTPGDKDRLMKIKVSATKAEVGTQQQQFNDPAVFPTVKAIVGGKECPVEVKLDDTTNEAECDKMLLPAFGKDFRIESENVPYFVQFNIEDIPETTPSTVTSKKTSLGPGGTSPPTTCPTTTCPTTACPTTACPTTACPTTACPTTACPTPTVTSCTCSTSTTSAVIPSSSEVPSTTMGATTSTVTSLITILSVYYIF